jgi:hypothetical protein
MLPEGKSGTWGATAEHLTLKRDGGTVAQSNIVAAHNWCNSNREHRDVSQGPPFESAPRSFRRAITDDILKSYFESDAEKKDFACGARRWIEGFR